MDEEEKKALIAEVIEKTKAELAKEAKSDIEKINKLIADERKAHEDMLKGKITEAEFKSYQEKSHAAEEEIKKRVDAIETKMNRPDLPTEDKKEKEPIEKKAFFKFLRKDFAALDPEEQKAMQISDQTTGGYIVIHETRNKIIELLTQISPIRQLASVENIGGTTLELPKEGIDTVTAAWPDETLVAGDYKFAMEKFEPHELRALVTPKKTLLEDAQFNLEEYIVRKTSTKFAKKEGSAHVNGNGVSKPEGLLTNTEIAEVKSGDASTLTADGIIKLTYELPEDYEPNASFLMKRSTILDVRLFKDSQNQYIWQPSYQAGQPSRLLGFPIYAAVDMPAVAAGTYPILFGDFKQAYQIVDRIDIEVQRLVEKYAIEGLVGFLFRKRTDAQVILAEALKKQKVSA